MEAVEAIFSRKSMGVSLSCSQQCQTYIFVLFKMVSIVQASFMEGKWLPESSMNPQLLVLLLRGLHALLRVASLVQNGTQACASRSMSSGKRAYVHNSFYGLQPIDSQSISRINSITYGNQVTDEQERVSTTVIYPDSYHRGQSQNSPSSAPIIIVVEHIILEVSSTTDLLGRRKQQQLRLLPISQNPR